MKNSSALPYLIEWWPNDLHSRENLSDHPNIQETADVWPCQVAWCSFSKEPTDRENVSRQTWQRLYPISQFFSEFSMYCLYMYNACVPKLYNIIHENVIFSKTSVHQAPIVLSRLVCQTCRASPKAKVLCFRDWIRRWILFLFWILAEYEYRYFRTPRLYRTLCWYVRLVDLPLGRNISVFATEYEVEYYSILLWLQTPHAFIVLSWLVCRT